MMNVARVWCGKQREGRRVPCNTVERIAIKFQETDDTDAPMRDDETYLGKQGNLCFATKNSA